jgi:hypothetical protein
MRKSTFYLLLSGAFLYSNTCIAQGINPNNSMQGPAVGPRNVSAFQSIVTINGQDGFYLKKDLYLTTSYTVIKGQKVAGIPFLFMEWNNGILTTPDGRVYSDYKFKYNVYDQTVFFLNGKDSLEVNEEIKEFTLKIPVADSIITSRFIHSSQFHKGDPVYYEVLLDNDKGQLLKTNQKVVANAESNLLTTQTKKYLKLESAYFYFDKKTKKIAKIRAYGNFASVLGLSEQEAKELQVDSFDPSKEEDVIRLFKKYFEKKGLKGF